MSDSVDEPREQIANRLDERIAPEPVAHGAGIQCVLNDASRGLPVYTALHQLWYDVVGSRAEEPGGKAHRADEVSCRDDP
ncbi:MAG: hypothetical protein ACOC06_02000 [Halorubrum sp.]